MTSAVLARTQAETRQPDEAPVPAAPAQQAAQQAAQAGGVRPMRRDDIAAIEDMFFRIFRPGRSPQGAGFARYFRQMFFETPYLEEEKAGVVFEDENGRLGAVIALLPISYLANGRRLTARMVCAFMSESGEARAAARLVIGLRARKQDLLYSDSASHQGAKIWPAAGGMVLPVQSLDWHCVFRPLTHGAQRLRLPGLLEKAAGLVDRMLVRRLRRTHYRPEAGAEAVEIDRARYIDLAPGMIAHFAVRPEWSPEEMTWLLDMAALNATLGPLRFFAVPGRDGAPVGCFAYFDSPRGNVRVLDLLSLPGHEAETVGAALERIGAGGANSAHGTTHPHLLATLSSLPGLHFRHRSYTCIATRHDDIKAAAAHNEMYVGGLAGESWSRLMTDFY